MWAKGQTATFVSWAPGSVASAGQPSTQPPVLFTGQHPMVPTQPWGCPKPPAHKECTRDQSGSLHPSRGSLQGQGRATLTYEWCEVEQQGGLPGGRGERLSSLGKWVDHRALYSPSAHTLIQWKEGSGSVTFVLSPPSRCPCSPTCSAGPRVASSMKPSIHQPRGSCAPIPVLCSLSES